MAHAFMKNDGSPSLTMDYDQLYDVPMRTPASLRDPLSNTHTGIFPSLHKHPSNRTVLRQKAVQKIGRGSPTFENTVVGRIVER